MVVYKRRPTNERHVEVSNDSYVEVEVDSRRSYNDSQTEIGDIASYSTRESFGAKQPKKEVMPSIKKEAKQSVEQKQSVSSKAKVLLAAYIIIALVLAAVVIGTGVAITEIGNRSDALTDKVDSISTTIDMQNTSLTLLNSDSYIIGEGTKNGLEVIDERTTLELVPTVNPVKYEKTTNGFDEFLDFLSRIFG